MTTFHDPRPITVRPRTRKRWTRFLWPAVALIIGLGVGANTAQAPPPQTIEKVVNVPGPERVVEKKVPGPTVEIVPKECLSALDYADQGFTTFAGILQSLLDGDVSAMDAGNAKVRALAPKYNLVKAACRGAGTGS